jgi:hypothetical protein
MQIQWDDIKQAMSTFVPVQGGYSDTTRGIVTFPDGQKVFVKLAGRNQDHAIHKEVRAYRWLEAAGYKYAPRLVAAGAEGFALPDLSAFDWRHVWAEAKVDAALRALNALVALPGAGSFFKQSLYDSNPWRALPSESSPFRSFLDDDSFQAVEAIINDPGICAEYLAAGDTEPWRGTDLVHYDVRADNFAYDSASGIGLLVDWNWAGLGNTSFDRTYLLVTIQAAGYDILPRYRQHLDRNSIIWLMGFWLERSLLVHESPARRQLRPMRIANVIAARKLLERL